MSYASLRSAEDRAIELFDEVVRRGLVVAGKTERALNEEVMALASETFGVRRHWHKRIVRAGANTLFPYDENPPDLVIGEDEILFFDFGPIFEEWEADIGRTYVIGNDPRKRALAADAASAFEAGIAHFVANPDLTASALYRFVYDLAKQGGWEFGHIHSGHLVGRFPHEGNEPGDITGYIRADNHLPLRRLAPSGDPLQWILEIHFVDRAASIGAFHEGLLPG